MMKYRRITADDDETIAKVIRANLEHFHLDIPGTAYFEPGLDHLSDFYNSVPEKRCYLVALDETDKIIGGVGIAELNGIENCAELQKLYLVDSVKGRGYGKELVLAAETWAKDAGYGKMYLETHHNLEVAIYLYEKVGFKLIDKPSFVVHGAMDHFYLKDL